MNFNCLFLNFALFAILQPGAQQPAAPEPEEELCLKIGEDCYVDLGNSSNW